MKFLSMSQLLQFTMKVQTVHICHMRWMKIMNLKHAGIIRLKASEREKLVPSLKAWDHEAIIYKWRISQTIKCKSRIQNPRKKDFSTSLWRNKILLFEYIALRGFFGYSYERISILFIRIVSPLFSLLSVHCGSEKGKLKSRDEWNEPRRGSSYQQY